MSDDVKLCFVCGGKPDCGPYRNLKDLGIILCSKGCAVKYGLIPKPVPKFGRGLRASGGPRAPGSQGMKRSYGEEGLAGAI